MRRVAAVLLLCLMNALLPSATALALTAPGQLMPTACRVHRARDCGMMSAMGGDAAPASGPQFVQFGCASGHCLQAVLSGFVSVTSRNSSGLVLAITLVRLLQTADLLPALTFSSSTPRAPPLSNLSPLSRI